MGARMEPRSSDDVRHGVCRNDGASAPAVYWAGAAVLLAAALVAAAFHVRVQVADARAGVPPTLAVGGLCAASPATRTLLLDGLLDGERPDAGLDTRAAPR